VTTGDDADVVAVAIRELAVVVGSYPDVIRSMQRHAAVLQATGSADEDLLGYFLECVAGP
jgi:hypothetical protein